jgi:transmembrane sensor
VAAADPEAAFAWTAGRLVFQDERLADVAVTLNRYVKTPVVVAPAAQDLRVTATLVVGPEDDMVRSLAAFLPVQVEQRTDSVRLSPRRQAR